MDLEKKILSDITVHMKYAKFIDREQRRENWGELVARNMQMQIKKFPHLENEIISAPKPTVVYVCMVGNIIHRGHVGILKHASKLGRVIVGPLSGGATEGLKRAPVVSWGHRKIVVENLCGVFSVVKQETLDQTGNLKIIKPDYVVHGSDWKSGALESVRAKVIETLKEWGGQVVEPEYTHLG